MLPVLHLQYDQFPVGSSSKQPPTRYQYYHDQRPKRRPLLSRRRISSLSGLHRVVYGKVSNRSEDLLPFHDTSIGGQVRLTDEESGTSLSPDQKLLNNNSSPRSNSNSNSKSNSNSNSNCCTAAAAAAPSASSSVVIVVGCASSAADTSNTKTSDTDTDNTTSTIPIATINSNHTIASNTFDTVETAIANHLYSSEGNTPEVRVQSSAFLSTRPRPAGRSKSAAAVYTSALFSQHIGRDVTMEEVHGVDVSWLHHPTKETKHHRHPSASRPRDNKPPPTTQSPSANPPPSNGDIKGLQVAPSVTAEPAKDTTPAYPAPPTSPTAVVQNSMPPKSPSSKRPGLLSRNSSEKVTDGKTLSRRSSWLNNISSKFSASTPERPSPSPTTPNNITNNASSHPNGASSPAIASPVEDAEKVAPYVPSKPKDSFFSTLTRRLSAGSQSGGIPKVQGSGGVCARRILNVDPNRERCLLSEFDSSRLRKVSFCVDVEIAGGPRYKDEEEEDDDMDLARKKKDYKMKERAEGEALKHPETLAESKEEDGEVDIKSEGGQIIKDDLKEIKSPVEVSPSVQKDGATSTQDVQRENKKREKKKRSEEERKERQEKRKRRAEENGSIPVEMSFDQDGKNNDQDDFDSIASSSLPSNMATSPPGAAPIPPVQKSVNPTNDRPTTDPVRIYRRCCQLRETPILKRITEQLMSPNCTVPTQPGVVNCLDLTHSRLQQADMVTLGDWLAVVPVKQLKMEDADITDEGLRCVLAGLLAAKRPEPTRRKSLRPRHREILEPKRYQERAGVIERLNLKQNPRIGRNGFKHISLFLYMCRSIKAIDLSMNQFPDTLPPSTSGTPLKGGQKPNGDSLQDTDAAETLYKCLVERPGGSHLEELILSECGLRADQIRKIVDGATVSGVARMGLAGNNLDDQGLKHVIRYIRSGICNALDIGSNDLRQRLPAIAEALQSKPDLPLWGLSLAACNLNTASTKALFPALAKLPNFRFLDLSRNRELCAKDDSVISLFRRYLGQLKDLKRLHLADVGMTSKQAIALADALPDGPSLAHLSILENKQLTAVANAKDEASQEEACALYASLMAAVRVSTSIICIDIDVPSPESSEIVKALAKQVVAYSLRNMEHFAFAEPSGTTANNAAARLTGPHGGQSKIKEVIVPDVLMHLVGHVDGYSENHDNDEPAPDDDYIVGGTGVVRALQYVLGEKANDLRRSSVPGSPISGALTPRADRPGSSAGLAEEQRFRAKKMSKNLLESARKIRARLQPALVKEAQSGDDMAYRRLVFLDNTLRNMIQRFEEEFPETRLSSEASINDVRPSPLIGSTESPASEPNDTTTIGAPAVDTSAGLSDDDADDDAAIRPAVKRVNSDVSLASRALSREEGHLHRASQHLRREVINTPTAALPVTPNDESAADERRIRALTDRVEAMSGPEIRDLVAHKPGGWADALAHIGLNYEDVRKWFESDPQGWETFKEAQLKAQMNMNRELPGNA